MSTMRQIDHNQAGEEVKRLLQEDGTANAALKDLSTAKAARKEQLKAALAVVWLAFESGQTVNGFATKEEWCAKFAGCTMRHAQHLIYGRKPEANVRSLALKPGCAVRVGGRRLELTGEMIDAILALAPAEENPEPAKNSPATAPLCVCGSE